MECLILKKELVEDFRELNREVIGITLAEDLNVTNVTILESQGDNPDEVFIDTNEDFNIVIHNHMEEDSLDFSDVDFEFMMPNLYYILVTQATVLACFNKEYIKCDLN